MNLAELSAFAASLNHLDREEIQKAKLLFLKNEIIKHKASYKTRSLNLLFLVIMGTIFLFLAFRDLNRNLVNPGLLLLFTLLGLFIIYIFFSSSKVDLITEKQQISNALEIWKGDLGNNYFELKTKLENAKSNIPIISIFFNN